MSVDKLILGTAGLGGQPYGREGRVVCEADAKAIINAAYSAGIRAFDTSPLYGNAETILSEALHGRPAQIFTKTTGDRIESIRSLGKFREQALTYLFHNWDERARVPEWVQGVSIYSDLFMVVTHYIFSFIQVDWNILQQTNLEWGGKDHVVIARSIFLQGVLAGGPIPNNGLLPHVEAASEFAKAYDVSMPVLALRAALEHERINKIVIGPTSHAELDLCLAIATASPLGLGARLSMLRVDDQKLTDPRTWT